jgi:hypothetical protein
MAPTPAVILFKVREEAAPVGVDEEAAVVWETVTVAKVSEAEAEEAAAVVGLESEEAPVKMLVRFGKFGSDDEWRNEWKNGSRQVESKSLT